MKKIFYFAALAAMVASCAKDPMVEPVTPTAEGTSTTLSIAMAQSESTRISVDEMTSSAYTFRWDKDESVGAVSGKTVTEFPMTSYGYSLSEFSLNSYSGGDYYVVSPYVAGTPNDNDLYYFDIAQQDGTMNKT